MNTVGFFLQKASLGDVDCTALPRGNPGIGGTEYEFLLIATEVARRYPDDFRVVVLSPSNPALPPSVEVRVIEDNPESLFQGARDAGCSILVLDAKLPMDWFRPGDVAPCLKLVAWAHLDANWRKYRDFAVAPNVTRLVCVGREQLDLLRDHDIYRKATYIYNACPFDETEVLDAAEAAGPLVGRGHRVAFVGSLTPSKGFHFVADAWPMVLRRVPDAELHVYGSGRLYHKDAELGPFGLAEESFERRFSRSLLQSDGTMHPSVRFHGICHGREMREELARAKVGVINPNTDETFGLSAVDLQLAGCHMVVRRSPGVMDTCGYAPFSYASRSSLPGRIVAALIAEDQPSVEDAIESVQRRFGLDVITPQWHRLLLDVIANRPVEHVGGLVHLFYRLKWLRELNRHVRGMVPSFLPIGRWQEILPAVPRKALNFARQKTNTKGVGK